MAIVVYDVYMCTMYNVHKAIQFGNGICLPPLNYQNQYNEQFPTILVCTGVWGFRVLHVLKQNQIIPSITFALLFIIYAGDLWLTAEYYTVLY